MLLDQQVPMEWAFAGPATLRRRLGHLDAARIAAMDVDDFVAVCCEKPAIHRFPAVARPAHPRSCASCSSTTTTARGEQRLGAASPTAPSCTAGCGRCRATATRRRRIFVAILGKTQGVTPDGWREAAGQFGDDVPRSVADITDAESLARVREWKQAQKAAQRDKQDRPLT